MLLRPGEIGSCRLHFAQAALNSPIRNSLGAPSHTEPEAKPGCASEGFPADQILAFGTASMKNLSLQQGKCQHFPRQHLPAFLSENGDGFALGKSQIRKGAKRPFDVEESWNAACGESMGILPSDC